MVIDHVNEICLGHTKLLMEMVGRGTFPLFCYALAMAAMKIRCSDFPLPERKKRMSRYMVRLFVGALIAQPFYYYAFSGDMPGNQTVNVIFTLALGAVFAAVSFRAKLWHMYALYVAAAVSMLWSAPLEFGLAGVMVPSALVLAMCGDKGVYPFLILLLVMMNSGGILNALQSHAVGFDSWVVVALNGLFSIMLPWITLDIARHMPQTGRLLPKYALYVFYPAHLVILKALTFI